MLRADRADLLIALAALPPLVLFLLTEHRIAGAAGLPLDDPWIHLHFARNIAEGNGFAYNPGTPVAGSTAPLWTLLIAAGFAIFGPHLTVVKGIGIAATLGAALITRRAALAYEVPPALAFFAGIVLLWTGPMVWGALSGMEVSLAALLVAAALLAHTSGRDWLTATLAALAALARPEALLLIPLLVLGRPLHFRRVTTFAAITVMLLAPAVAFSLRTVGAPIPATAAAKVEGGLMGWLTGSPEPMRITWIVRSSQYSREWIGWLWSTHWLLPWAVIPGIIVVWTSKGRALGVPALALIVHPLAMAVIAPYRGPAFQEGRYSIHLFPLALLVGAVALGELRPSWRRLAVITALVVAPITLIPAAARYGRAVQNINGMQVHLGRWVDANVPKTATLALNDVGAIAYFSRRKVIDLIGLVTPEIIRYRWDGERGVLRFLSERCPDYVIIFPAWFPLIAGRRDLLEPIYSVRLTSNTVAGAPEMVVYRLARCTV